MALHEDIDHSGLTGIPAAITEITDIATAEMDDALVLAPDGAGGVEFRAEAGGGGIADEGAFTYLDATEAAAPGTPAAGYVRIYAKTDGRVYSKDDGGVEYGPFDTAGGGAADSNDQVLSMLSSCSIGRHMSGFALNFTNAGNQGWPSANLAILTPFVLPAAATAYKLGWRNGGTVSGNVDIGIYDASGTKVIAAGSTAASGTNAVQLVDIADTALSADTLYYLALAADNTSQQFLAWDQHATLWTAMGCREKAASFALPATITGTAVRSGSKQYHWFVELKAVA